MSQVTIAVGQADTGGVVSSGDETMLTTTAATSVTTYSTGVNGGNFGVYGYFELASGCSLDIVVSWVDGSGLQSVLAISGNLSAGSVTLSPLFIYAVGGSTISIIATASIANVVRASGTIETLSLGARNPLVLASASEQSLPVGSTTLLSYTPATTGNFGVFLCYRTQADCAMTAILAWADAFGAQSSTVVSGAAASGQFVSMPIAHVDAVAGSALSLTLTSDTANAVVASASLKGM